MLRSLGSSLVAKASPGAALRKTQENRAQMPPLTETGQPGSLSRMQLEEPLVRQVPAGSQKIVSVQPSVEGTTVAPGITAPVPGVGLTPEMTAPKVPAGGQNQPLFQGGVGTPAGQAPTAKPGTTVSQAGGAKPAVVYQPKPEPTPAPETQGGQTQYQIPRTQDLPLFQALLNNLGGKVRAAGEQIVPQTKEKLRTAGQSIAATLAGANPLTGWMPAELAQKLFPNPVRQAAINYASKPTNTGSISGGLRSLGNAVGSKLRSLGNIFRR